MATTAQLEKQQFFQHVKDRGFSLEERSIVTVSDGHAKTPTVSAATRRYVLSKQERTLYFDIDESMLAGLSSASFIQMADLAMNDLDEKLAREH